MKKKIAYIFTSILMMFILFLNIQNTNAKYVCYNYGIAWENYFTEYEQLQSVFYITSSTGSKSENLFGATAGNLSENIKPVKYKDEYYYVTNNKFSSNYRDYALNTLQNVEFNVANQTSEDMVVVFVLHYYSKKITTKDTWWNRNTTSLSFGIYNTYIHDKDDSDVSIASGQAANAKSVLKGELVVNTGNSVFCTNRYDYLPEVVAERLSGSPTEQSVNLSTTYTHRAVINPYAILYDSGSPIGFTHIPESTIVNGYNENGTTSVFASYSYPAYDYDTSKNACDSSISNPGLLDEFILLPGEAASFNVNLFYGNYGATSSSSSDAFLMSVDMYGVSVNSMKENIEKVRNKTVKSTYIPGQ